MVMWVLSMLVSALALVNAGEFLRGNDNNALNIGARAGSSQGSPVINQGKAVNPFSSAIEGGALGGNFVDNVFGGSGLGSSGGQKEGFRSNPFSGFGGSSFGTADIFGDVEQQDSPREASALDQFDDNSNGFQRGLAQVSVLDKAAQRSDRRDDRFARDFAAQEQGVGRRDNQERQGNLKEQEKNDEKEKESFKAQKQQENFNQQAGLWNLDSRRQNDQESKLGTVMKSDGELLRSDLEANDGGKTLGVRKTAFTNGNLGFENIGYNFDKDFDQTANERGGYKETSGRNDNNIQIYQEKKRDHRFANSDNEAFRKSDDLSRKANSNKWLQNAKQSQGQKSQFGKADKLQDAAAKKAEDFKTFFDKRDDRIWNLDRAKDNAYRGAEDAASKNGLYNKDAIARATGKKGVADNKFYGGFQSGSAPGYGGAAAGAGQGYGGGNAPWGYNTAGVDDTSPEPKVAYQGQAVGAVSGVGQPDSDVRGRHESSGGDVLNAYNEKALQGDLANQLSNNHALSRADARNNYLRNRGLQDSIQANKANQGKWANQKEGFRDNRRQGFNGGKANASKGGESQDNSFSDALSSSNLESAEKGLDQAKLDRINLKRNQVDSNQNIRSKKQFYHDKHQGGFNNEGLNYNRNRGNNDFGAQEAAEKEARTRFSNLHKDSKNSRGQRQFDDSDFKKISNGEAVFKRQNANNGAAAAFARAADQARARAGGFNRNRGRQEVDRFQQLNNQRNQKHWDRNNRDLFGRSNGNNVGRRIDGSFQYQNNPPNNRLGYRQSDNSVKQLGKSSFGSVPLGKVQGGYNTYDAPVQDAPGSRDPTQSKRAVIDDVGAGIGQTQFGNYW